MTRYVYEHLHIDLSAQCLHVLEKGVARLAQLPGLDTHVHQELQNFGNECRSRLQRIAQGEPDISEGDPRVETATDQGV